MFQLNNLKFKYPKESFSLDVEEMCFKPGTVTAVVGGNGSGKTTLFNLLSGVYEPISGMFSFEGKESKSIGKLSCRIVMHNAHAVMSPYHTVLQACQLIANLYGVNSSEAAIRELAGLLRCEPLLECSVKSLSSGQKQRAMFLRSLSSNPDIIILDEPTTALDSLAIEQTLSLIKQLTELGKIVIIASHYPYELRSLLPKIIGLSNGRVVYVNESVSELMPEEKLTNIITDNIEGHV